MVVLYTWLNQVMPMDLDYEIYKNYDTEARTEIVLPEYLTRKLFRMNTMLEFFDQERQEIVTDFVSKLSQRLAEELKDDMSRDLDYFKEAATELRSLTKHGGLFTLSLRFLLNILEIPVELPSDGRVEVSLLSTEKADSLIPYFCIKILVEMLGREAGIQLYKGYVDYLAEVSPPRKLKDFREARVSWIKGMADSGGFDFAVLDLDENKFLAKFDRCVCHEALKDEDDPELGYLVVCYPGWWVGQQQDWCVRMRRTQTLFSGDFCDELYWNRHIHDEPEQPSLDLSSRLVL